jgi:hypothetical protein
MLGVTPSLKLALFQASEDGWAAGMNANLQKIDTELTSAVSKVNDRAREVENNLALRIIGFVQAVDAQNRAYATNLEAAKTEAVNQIRTYVDSLLAEPITRAQENQTAILEGIALERARLTDLERKIEQSFLDARSHVDTLFSELSTELSSNVTVIINMRDALQALLNELAGEINTHVSDYNNPHQVTFDQAGGQESLVYVRDPARDAHYTPD